MLAAAPLLHAEDTSREKWEAKLSSLTNGMTRAEVEKILPQGAGMGGLFGSGSGYTIIYNLDDSTAVSLSYDYTGRKRNAVGQTIDAQNPSNRLTRVNGLLDPIRKKPAVIEKGSNKQIQATGDPLRGPPAPDL